jgi:hypothetical protein
MKKIFFNISGLLTLLWGIAHLFPTAGIVKDFGDISLDNKLIITMEWIVEGLTLIFIGVLIMVVTKSEINSRLARNVYTLTTGILISMAILSLFTGFRVNFITFKLCPIIFSVSAILIILGMISNSKTSN